MMMGRIIFGTSSKEKSGEPGMIRFSNEEMKVD